MSGYLRWLAGRALGQGSGVRPLRPPISLARTVQSEGPLPADHGEAASADFSQGQFAPPAGRSPQHQSRPSSGVEHGIPLESDLASGEVQVPAPSESAAGSHIPIYATAKDEPRPILDRRESPDAGRRGLDRQRDIAAEASLPIPPVPASEDRPDEIADRPRSIPERPLAPRVAARAIRDRPADVRTSGLEATPPADVHIHIGRVELTAVTPAAPSRRESAATAKKPMSLDEYLRQRGRRPS